MKSTIVIKVGGAFLNDVEQAHPLLSRLARLKNNYHVVLVHGGGSQVQDMLTAAGIESEKLNGLRVTPDEHMPYVSGALAGYVNKQLSVWCQQYDLNAVGIALTDGNITECEVISEELGAVGSASANDPTLLNTLLNANFTPLISSIGNDKHNRLLNVNADDAAATIAKLLDAELMLLSDVAGVLDQDKNLIHQLDHQNIEALYEANIITDGMAVKVKAALDVANTIGKDVTIGSWANPAGIEKLSCGSTFGTRITPNNK